ncbi:MAG: hypothetical protein K0S61_560 [Anaerocolumna sp.]|nr:hypothetical protein [Anaerocolumna sp.]
MMFAKNLLRKITMSCIVYAICVIAGIIIAEGSDDGFVWFILILVSIPLFYIWLRVLIIANTTNLDEYGMIMLKNNISKVSSGNTEISIGTQGFVIDVILPDKKYRIYDRDKFYKKGPWDQDVYDCLRIIDDKVKQVEEAQKQLVEAKEIELLEIKSRYINNHEIKNNIVN